MDVLDRMNGDWFLISDWSLLPTVYSFDLTMHLVAFFFFFPFRNRCKRTVAHLTRKWVGKMFRHGRTRGVGEEIVSFSVHIQV